MIERHPDDAPEAPPPSCSPPLVTSPSARRRAVTLSVLVDSSGRLQHLAIATGRGRWHLDAASEARSPAASKPVPHCEGTPPTSSRRQSLNRRSSINFTRAGHT
jgi:hypothetical protein